MYIYILLYRWLLSHGCDVCLEQQNLDGKRPLHSTVQSSHLPPVKILLDNGRYGQLHLMTLYTMELPSKVIAMTTMLPGLPYPPNCFYPFHLLLTFQFFPPVLFLFPFPCSWWSTSSRN